MSSKVIKTTLSGKLSKKTTRAQQIQSEAAAERTNVHCTDIEDAIGIFKSEHFSPMQTRQQRKTTNKPVKMREVTNLKRVKVENAKDAPAVAEKIEKPQKAIDEIEVEASVDAIWEPKHWQTVLQNIRQMRAVCEAPVDTMGCNKCSDGAADNKTQRFHVLVSLMLSSQTKDETTFKAMERLRSHNLTPETLIAMDVIDLENLLKPVSFHKTKAKHLQQTSRILIEQYNSDIPQSIAQLVKLPGVGPKMAHLCMSEAWNEVTGIGVDVHVHRISNRLNWLPKQTKKPEETRVSLESWLPRTLWREVNHLLVGFGQTICTPLRPRCTLCLNYAICPSAELVAKKKSPKKEKKKMLL